MSNIAQMARLSAFPGNSDPAARVALVVALGEASKLHKSTLFCQGNC